MNNKKLFNQVVRKAVLLSISSSLLLLASSKPAQAEAKIHGFMITKNVVEQVFAKAGFTSFIDMAKKVLSQDKQYQGLFQNGDVEFTEKRVEKGDYSTTLKFLQKYKGVEVVGYDAAFHYDNNGELADASGTALKIALDTNPELSLKKALQILEDRYQAPVILTEEAKLKVFNDFDNKPHLVYHVLTKTTDQYPGQEVYLDAHTGEVLLEHDRTFHMFQSTVYSADTKAARLRNDMRGYPMALNTSWYDKVIVQKGDDKTYSEELDRPALNANRNAKKVYDYYRDTHQRLSYDDKDSPIVSVVHMGVKMNNAFWSSEDKIIAYGDGDGEHLKDLTYGLDVAAHEITHAVTTSTAGLIYAAESGALNESYSDFFGKMVAFQPDNWYIGDRVISPKWNRKAIRNMMKPEEFGQPGTNDSDKKVSVTGPCNRSNDRCGVHTNSGIPNRAAALIVEAIGKDKAEKIYYNVLTKRLHARSDFAHARSETEKACKLILGKDSKDCKKVSTSFDKVGM